MNEAETFFLRHPRVETPPTFEAKEGGKTCDEMRGRWAARGEEGQGTDNSWQTPFPPSSSSGASYSRGPGQFRERERP